MAKTDPGTRRGVVNGVALAVVVVATAWAAFQSNAAQRDGRLTQQCTTTTLFGVVQAVNERTRYNTPQTQANLELQKAQADFLKIVLDENSGKAEQDRSIMTYTVALNKYITLVGKTVEQTKQYPYPTQQSYLNCLRHVE